MTFEHMDLSVQEGWGKNWGVYCLPQQRSIPLRCIMRGMGTAATHEDLNRKLDVKGSSNRSFGMVFAVFFALVAVLPLRRRHPVRWWALALSACFLVVALMRPSWLTPLNRLWTKLGLLLGRIVSPIVTALLFFLVVTPTGMILRLRRKDPLRLSFDAAASSYWIERQPPGPLPETMANQF